jgi:DNA-binding CsgD family transcriptional regulator
MESSSLGFLPFVDHEIPFVDSLNLMEILNAVCEEEDFQRALELLVVATFERHQAIGALLIAPGDDIGATTWKVSHQHNIGSNEPENMIFSLKSNHKIVKLIEQARVTRAYSNGKETANGPIFTSASNVNLGEFQETHGIVCIPLIQNLEARAGLIIILENQIEISGSDRSLLAGLQAIFSFFYFKRRRETNMEYGTNGPSFGDGMANHLTYMQKKIARLMLEGRSDKDIFVELNLNIEEFQRYYDGIARYVFAQTRDEIIQELSLMDLS